MSVIRLSNIDKSFGQVHALKDINIDIQSGEFFTLLGPSGCGKTTLLRIIAGFYNQDRGSIHIGERTMDGVPPYDRDTGMVFQNYAVFPHMTVFENVAFGLRNRRVPADEIRRRVASALETARLTGYEERTPDQLSGGQQQRVGLARALVIEPQVLLMDEPLSNLDAKLRLQMREEIRDIQRQLGITTVYVTHDQEEALVISDRIAVMNLGQIQQIGSAWDVYKRPANVFAAAFVGHMNFVEATLQSESGKRVFQVEGASETFDASPWRSLPAGVGVRLAFRPEDLAIGKDIQVEPGSLRLSCTVEKSIFTGALVQYTLRDRSGALIVAERHRPEIEGIIATGTAVETQVSSSSLHLFSAEDGTRVRREETP
jgi:iron(III) transport system ATP-binding protein